MGSKKKMQQIIIYCAFIMQINHVRLSSSYVLILVCVFYCYRFVVCTVLQLICMNFECITSMSYLLISIQRQRPCTYTYDLPSPFYILYVCFYFTILSNQLNYMYVFLHVTMYN